MKKFLTALVMLQLICPALLHAAPISETFIFHGSPAEWQIQKWSSLPGARGYLFIMPDPNAAEIERLGGLRGWSRLRIEMTRYPERREVAALKKLSALGAEFVAFGVKLPTDAQIALLNEIAPPHLVLVVPEYPLAAESRRLSGLKVDYAISFSVYGFPLEEDREGLDAIPKDVPLLYSSLYWPWYTHMDLFNRLGQKTLNIRMEGSFPSEASLPYLHNIHGLHELTVQTDFEVGDAKYWRKLDGLDVKWSSWKRVPDARELALFAQSANGRKRSVVVDRDDPLLTDERARLESCGVPVEWIHEAPFSQDIR
jgi:hypothetical protein